MKLNVAQTLGVSGLAALVGIAGWAYLTRGESPPRNSPTELSDHVPANRGVLEIESAQAEARPPSTPGGASTVPAENPETGEIWMIDWDSLQPESARTLHVALQAEYNSICREIVKANPGITSLTFSREEAANTLNYSPGTLLFKFARRAPGSDQTPVQYAVIPQGLDPRLEAINRAAIKLIQSPVFRGHLEAETSGEIINAGYPDQRFFFEYLAQGAKAIVYGSAGNIVSEIDLPIPGGL